MRAPTDALIADIEAQIFPAEHLLGGLPDPTDPTQPRIAELSPLLLRPLRKVAFCELPRFRHGVVDHLSECPKSHGQCEEDGDREVKFLHMSSMSWSSVHWDRE